MSSFRELGKGIKPKPYNELKENLSFSLGSFLLILIISIFFLALGYLSLKITESEPKRYSDIAFDLFGFLFILIGAIGLLISIFFIFLSIYFCISYPLKRIYNITKKNIINNTVTDDHSFEQLKNQLQSPEWSLRRDAIDKLGKYKVNDRLVKILKEYLTTEQDFELRTKAENLLKLINIYKVE